MQKRALFTFALAALFLANASLCGAQLIQQPTGAPDFSRQQNGIPGRRGVGTDDFLDSSVRATMEAKRLKAVAEDRHKRMLADADRLVKLTDEVKAELSKTSSDELSVSLVKKSGDIEKLAHDLRARMVN